MRSIEIVGRGSLVAMLALTFTSCIPKDSDFFGIEDADIGNLPDITAPVFSDLFPYATVTGPQNVTTLSFTLADPVGPNGAPASGIDPSRVTVSVNGQSYTPTASGSVWTVDLGTGDRDVSWQASAYDLAGNQATASSSFLQKNTGPAVNLTEVPSATGTFSGSSYSVTMSGEITDDYLGVVVGGYFLPGPDDVCGTADDALIPEGTGPGQISQNAWDYGLSAPGGSFSLSSEWYNWTTASNASETRSGCAAGVAHDIAGDGRGGLDSNETRWGSRFDVTAEYVATTGSIGGTVTLGGSPLPGVTVSAGGKSVQTGPTGEYIILFLNPGSYSVSVSDLPDNVVCTPASKSASVSVGVKTPVDFSCATQFAIGLTGSYLHHSGYSTICVTITTTPAQPGASYTATASGPGVLGSGVHDGTLDVNGTASVSNDIGLYGSYTWLLSIGAFTASTTVNVTGADGTCTP